MYFDIFLRQKSKIDFIFAEIERWWPSKSISSRRRTPNRGPFKKLAGFSGFFYAQSSPLYISRLPLSFIKSAVFTIYKLVKTAKITNWQLVKIMLWHKTFQVFAHERTSILLNNSTLYGWETWKVSVNIFMPSYLA